MISKIKSIMVDYKQERKIKELKEIIGDPIKFWRTFRERGYKNADPEVETFCESVDKIKKEAYRKLEESLSKYKSEGNFFDALRFKRTFRKELLYTIIPLEKISSSGNRISYFFDKCFIT